jgi:predicted nucleotidyltransferase
MNNESLFNDVYSKNSQIVPTRIFRGDVKPELENYKMGIFGSLTPTSDIDIGVQYSGEIIGLIGLSYIVSIFEDLFS